MTEEGLGRTGKGVAARSSSRFRSSLAFWAVIASSFFSFAKQSRLLRSWDCFVATLLAVTRQKSSSQVTLYLSLRGRRFVSEAVSFPTLWEYETASVCLQRQKILPDCPGNFVLSCSPLLARPRRWQEKRRVPSFRAIEPYPKGVEPRLHGIMEKRGDIHAP